MISQPGDVTPPRRVVVLVIGKDAGGREVYRREIVSRPANPFPIDMRALQGLAPDPATLTEPSMRLPKFCPTCSAKWPRGGDKCGRCGTWKDGATRPKGRGGQRRAY